jgi:hypothetical protein
MEVVPLDYAGETLSFRDSDNVDDFSGFEDICLDLGSEFVSTRIIEPQFDEIPGTVDLCFLKMSGPGLARSSGRSKGKLNGRITILLGTLDLRDATGPGLDHGDRHGVPVTIEDLGHPDLATEDAFNFCHCASSSL